MARYRVAFYGGSFNPVHIGHAQAILQILSLMEIDTLVVAPVYTHAHGKIMAPFYDRVDMVKRMLSVFGNSCNTIVSTVEEQAVRAGGTGLTSEAIRQLRKSHQEMADAHITLVLGEDCREALGTWAGFDDLAKMIKTGQLTVKFLARQGISSTEIRKLYELGDDEAISKLVPASVRWYIDTSGLYRLKS